MLVEFLPAFLFLRRRNVKAAIFDIETTSLDGGGAGILLCACVRPLETKRTRTYRLKPKGETQEGKGFLEAEETELLQELLEELGKYDLLIGQNIAAFDLPMLRSRAYRRGVDFRLTPFVYDTLAAFRRINFRTAPGYNGKPKAALDFVADFLGVEQEKTKIYPVAHWQTIWGNVSKREQAMREIIAHCEADVRMTAKIYEIFLPLDKKAVIKRWF